MKEQVTENKVEKAQVQAKNLLLRSSPHRVSTESVGKVMWTVIAALSPAICVTLWYFGLMGLRVIVGCVVLCMVFEFLLLKLRFSTRKACGFALDGSAAVTGVLLAMNMPASSPLWMLAVGCLVAMLLGKHIFGGVGQNIFNPALVARVFLMFSFPAEMTAWTQAQSPKDFFNLDAISAATPLGIIKSEGLLEYTSQLKEGSEDLFYLFSSFMPSSQSEVSILALLIGAGFLIWRGYIRWQIPVSFIATTFALTCMMWLIYPDTYASPVIHILSGGLILGALFMATDMVTTPVSTRGMIIFGIGCGFFTAVIRLFGSFPEGVAFAILLMNGLTPFIDRYTRPPKFGAEKTTKELTNA